MRAVVVGAGKMGLPLACQFGRNGACVTVCDIRKEAVDAINRGECLIDEPGIPELVTELHSQGKLTASTDTAGAAKTADVVVVIVPVLLSPERDADLSAIESVSRQLASTLHPGMMISYETTLPVGTTRRLAGILETSGLKAGRDFDVVFSPERVKSQLVLEHLTKNAKVVGGITPEAAQRAADFYHKFLGAPIMNVGTLEAAELVKLAGMVYRDVTIAVSNELARYAETVGVDLHSILPAVNSDGEAALLSPGIGVGGHCTPVYPYFVIRHGQRSGVETPMTVQARITNDGQAQWCIDRLERCWMPVKDQEVLILGLGFRPQVKEHICSSSFLIGAELQRRGARAVLHDPLYSDDEIRAHGFTPFSLESGSLPAALILSTAHRQYAALDFSDLARRGVRAVVDGRALWNPQTVRSAGIGYIGVGRA